MPTIPRYAWIIGIGLVAIAAAYAIYASRKMASTAAQAKKLLDEGKISVVLTPDEIRDIAKNVKQSAN